MTGATIPCHVDSVIAISRTSYIGVACENGMCHTTPSKTCYKQVGIGAKSQKYVNEMYKAKPTRQQENKMYMGFDNEKVSPVRRHIPDFAVDNNYVIQMIKQASVQTKC